MIHSISLAMMQRVAGVPVPIKNPRCSKPVQTAQNASPPTLRKSSIDLTKGETIFYKYPIRDVLESRINCRFRNECAGLEMDVSPAKTKLRRPFFHCHP